MAIAKMLKMRLISVHAEQDGILNALHSTGAVELVNSQPLYEGLEKTQYDKSEIKDKREKAEQALSIITGLAKDQKIDLPQGETFGVSYADFMAIKQRECEILTSCYNVLEKKEEIAKLKAEIIAFKGEINGYLPYEMIGENFSAFKNTAKTICKLGYSEKNSFNKLLERLSEVEFLNVISLGEWEKGVTYAVIYHQSATAEAERLLSECGFVKCVFSGDFTAKEQIQSLKGKISGHEQKIKKLNEEILSFVPTTTDIKILSDYFLFEIEKLSGQDDFSRTKHTFILEAYVPEESKERVENALGGFDGHVYVEFEELGKNDYAPTLMKNNKAVKNFEFVTNLYSAPKYGEFDPNGFLGIFFAIFLGFMTADVVYGLLMVVGGLLYAKTQKRETGIKKLALVLAMAGVPTILFGVAFDSFLGIPLMRNMGLIQKSFLPDPIADSSLLAGISVPTLLLYCLCMGIVHIMASLIVRAYVDIKDGRVLDGICDGLIWALFLVGLLLLILTEIGVLPKMGLVPIIIIASAVVLGACTAGRHVKGFGKFTKGFGAVYGLINYMSDILSYARLYGLMLSGAQIAQIVSNQLALPMMQNGVGGVIGGIAVMFVGHVFNIAMGLLGAFIHGARLQYVESFSHFYTGDGDLFKPLGTTFEHVYFN